MWKVGISEKKLANSACWKILLHLGMQVDLGRPCPPAMPSTPSRCAQSSPRRNNHMQWWCVRCQTPTRSGARKCNRNAAQLIPQAQHHIAVEPLCVCVAIRVYGPPSASEKPAWSLAKGCSQTCCRDFARCVMYRAFFSLCSREECFAHNYLDVLQKNKALHYEKGSHSFKKKMQKVM